MKLWVFGSIINTLALFAALTMFLLLGRVSVDDFLYSFRGLDIPNETLRLIVTTLKIDFVEQWYYLLAAISIFVFLLITLVIYPLIKMCQEDWRTSEPKIFLYTVVSCLTLPLGGGIILSLSLMLLCLSGLKHTILESRQKWIEKERQKWIEEARQKLIEEIDELIYEKELQITHNQNISSPERIDRTIGLYGYSPKQVRNTTTTKEESTDSDFFTEEDFRQNAREMKKIMKDEYTEDLSHQPSYNRNFERRSITSYEIEDAEIDRRSLKDKLVKIENELDRIENSRVDRAKEISLRRKFREIEYDLEDNERLLERLRKRQIR